MRRSSHQVRSAGPTDRLQSSASSLISGPLIEAEGVAPNVPEAQSGHPSRSRLIRARLPHCTRALRACDIRPAGISRVLGIATASVAAHLRAIDAETISQSSNVPCAGLLTGGHLRRPVQASDPP